MDLVARFGRAPLGMAAFQVGVLLVLLAYGLWPPSLGTHLVLPGLVLIAAFAVMVWLTLTRPWEPEPMGHREPRRPGSFRVVYLWDKLLIVLVTLYVANLYRGVLSEAKDTLREITRERGFDDVRDLLMHAHVKEAAEAWAADPWGAELLSGGGVVIALFLPSVFLLILWLFLPR